MSRDIRWRIVSYRSQSSLVFVDGYVNIKFTMIEFNKGYLKLDAGAIRRYQFCARNKAELKPNSMERGTTRVYTTFVLSMIYTIVILNIHLLMISYDNFF